MVYFSGYSLEKTFIHQRQQCFRKESSGANQSYVGKGNYSTQDVRTIIKQELKGKLDFDRPNVLHRLHIQDVDDELVNRIRQELENDESFVESKNTLNKLREREEGKTKGGNDVGGEVGKKKDEREMMNPLSQIFNRILQFAVANDNGRARQYERKWIADAETPLQGEGDIFSFPEIKPDFTLCDQCTEVVLKERKKWEVLWRHRVAFIELKATSAQGPKPSAKESIVKAADYARLHLTSRPFLLFSIGLLVFGKEFCVAIFDRDGVQFSPIYDMWDDLNILIRIIRRMSHEMSPVDFGQDPNVDILPHDDPNSVACRKIATALASGNAGLINEVSNYPTYSIDFCNVKYYTIGLPVWNSLSLLGRGTSIWKVSASPTKSLATGIFLILKTSWRQSNRTSESSIMQRVKGSHDGLVQYSQGSDVFFPSSSPIAPPKITTANLRNQNLHVEGDTTILHRLIFKIVGRPIWEFDSYLEFFLAIKAALNAHKFLADQNILHRDISAGNVLLSSNPNAPDSQKGFLTDLEFARIDDETLETKNNIPVPFLPNPNRAKEMTIPTTRTHTTWTPPPRGAVLTGTVQFMACELVSGFLGENQQPIHRIHHDVESFVWVIYYAVLRRIAYVDRVVTEGRIPAKLRDISQKAFRGLFNYVSPSDIFAHRDTAPRTYIMFDNQQGLLPPPILEFFNDLRIFINTVRGREIEGTGENKFGSGTHEELLVVLDKVIAALRQAPQAVQG
ncbi:hypothetical protein Clacol_009788 [Clathrus columnatus]|uniref:Protein kinase domain-containing protein n=1 Tax=Clathrus columnatus TaxID=1419009 RepID=A0AAV5AM49_9AGAM|nr:hypothetical protein Clacol_009788 [Clathrus columnatus]